MLGCQLRASSSDMVALGDNQNIADAGAVRGGAVNGDDPGAPLGGNGVGGETVAVGDVPEVNSFILQNTGRIQEVLVNGARTFIVQVRLRDFYAVELALHVFASYVTLQP